MLSLPERNEAAHMDNIIRGMVLVAVALSLVFPLYALAGLVR